MKKSVIRRNSALVWLMIALFTFPLGLQSQTVDESKDPISQGIMAHPHQFCCDIAAVSGGVPLSPGAVTIQLRIVPHWICESFQVDVVKVDNLEYLGEMSWAFEASAGDTLYFPITVEIPANDTTGLRFEVGGCKCKHRTDAYFAASANEVLLYQFDPSASGERLREAREKANRLAIERARDSIAQLPPPVPCP